MSIEWDGIGCPKCGTISNAETAGCDGMWHFDNWAADIMKRQPYPWEPQPELPSFADITFVPETPPPTRAIDNPDPVTARGTPIDGLFFPDDFMQTESWWCLHSSRVRAMLVRAAAGDDPDVVMMEEYGNSLTWSPGGD